MKKTDHLTPIISKEQESSSIHSFLINSDYQDILQKADLMSFDRVWSLTGELVKKKDERCVYKVSLPLKLDKKENNPESEEKKNVFYIKKHRQKISLSKKILSIISPQIILTEGLKEFHHYCNFRKNRLATAIPVAAGMKKVSSFRLDSFLITHDFSPLVDLEHYILNSPSTLQGKQNHDKRNHILEQIALYAKRMHDSNLNHKDFNATHILLNNIENDTPEVALFDLQRVNTNRLSKFRWPIKALGELFYSLPKLIFSDQDKLSLFKMYKGKSHLSLVDHLQYYFILKKTEKIARHSAKRDLAPKARPTS